MPKPGWNDVRFVFDEDARGVGLALVRLRADMTCVGSPPIEHRLPLGTKDPDWIPVVAGAGWVAITKNAAIRTHPQEAPLAFDSGLRVACLVPGRDSAGRWDLARMLMQHWDAVEALHGETGPCWLSIYRDRTRRLPYEPGKAARSAPGRL